MLSTLHPPVAMRQHYSPLTVTVHAAEGELRAALLGARQRARRLTGHQLNPYVANLRKAIERGHTKPCAMIASVLLADLEAGTSLDRVLEFPRRLEAMLVTAARCVQGTGVLSLHEANAAEFRHNTVQDALQWLVASGDTSRRTLVALRAATAALIAHCQALVIAIDHVLYAERVA